MNSIVKNQSLELHVEGVVLKADMAAPPSPQGIVLFVHGSGSSRHSPRNRYVADQLQSGGLVTVLADLLTMEEEQFDARTGQLRFDIGLLASRVIGMIDWLVKREAIAGLDLGLFGASTGAAAALVAAAKNSAVEAVVSRGGRPDLAGEYLPLVRQPTLLIVGGNDGVVIDLNRNALELLVGESRLEIVPGASHLFEEPGTLEQVARLAKDWFLRHLERSQPEADLT
jgi:putative phosphoribosyl transferase